MQPVIFFISNRHPCSWFKIPEFIYFTSSGVFYKMQNTILFCCMFSPAATNNKLDGFKKDLKKCLSHFIEASLGIYTQEVYFVLKYEQWNLFRPIPWNSFMKNIKKHKQQNFILHREYMPEKLWKEYE